MLYLYISYSFVDCFIFPSRKIFASLFDWIAVPHAVRARLVRPAGGAGVNRDAVPGHDAKCVTGVEAPPAAVALPLAAVAALVGGGVGVAAR